MTLRHKWLTIFSNDNIDADKLNTAFDVIENCYSESHRTYHTLNHIEYMLNKIDNLLKVYLLDDASDKKALYLATWFHDIIYTTTQSSIDNERASAEFACKMLGELGIDDSSLLYTVYHLILCTKTHQTTSDSMVDTTLEAIMIDADLAILGDSEVVYANYKKEIYAEWAHLPTKRFLEGRCLFLKHMLNKSDIFISEYFKELFTEQAIANISQELQSIQQPSI